MIMSKKRTMMTSSEQENRGPLSATAAPSSFSSSSPLDMKMIAEEEGGTSVSDVIVEQAADLLPNQAILENFVHHNPLQRFESMTFKEALDHVHALEMYMSPGERLAKLVQVDPRKRANEALVDLSAAFLDRGAAKWAPPHRDKGFLYFFASLEGLGFAPWRQQVRQTARRVLAELQAHPDQWKQLAESILRDNLRFFGVPAAEWTNVVRAMMLELRGWAGMFHRMETHAEEAPPHTTVRLLEFCVVQSIMHRVSIEALARQSGWQPQQQSFGDWLSVVPSIRPEEHDHHFLHPSALASLNQCPERREMLEREFKWPLLTAIGTGAITPPSPTRPHMQIYTCIDDRECSFRRHVEELDPEGVETFGVAGFFGIPIRYEPADGRDPMTLAPEGAKPSAVLHEEECHEEHDKTVQWLRRRKWMAQLSLWWENASFSPLGSLVLAALSPPIGLLRLQLMGFAPNLNRTLRELLFNAVIPQPRTEIHLPFPADQAATMLARTFKDIGAHHRFAPLVAVIGHGSSSVNNPFAAAYNCGACGGREGGPNARLMAAAANDPEVRLHLQRDHGITIPDDTVFVGALHNTTSEKVEFYDVEKIPLSHRERFLKAKALIEQGRADNALERCHRFLLAKHIHTPAEALRYVQTRSVDAAEVRPELNHAMNAAVVVGRRALTKGRFLDRRAFLPSYDPFGDDDQGTNLEHVLAPALLVCSGINLEYLFSTIDVDHHGAGTKAPLNIVGNIGVLQGTTGDLRPGLPSQMTEMHSPLRALYVVDSPIERVEAVFARRQELKQLVRNEWVRFFVRDPYSNTFYKQQQGQYVPVEPHHNRRLDFLFEEQYEHATQIARREAMMHWTAMLGMLASCGVPLYLSGFESLAPHGPLVGICGTLLSLPVLAFARRYLHGEFMFGRFSALCVGLNLGFNMVAMAPNLEAMLAGWSLFGFASTFLIGAYNERPTVRNNATFAFAAYHIADMALLVAASFSGLHFLQAAGELGLQGGDLAMVTTPYAAAGLLLAAIFKSSQFPLTSLFVRSMEGPTPASALGYAGLSAHVGVVLLAGTMPLWFCYDWARVTLASLGLVTAFYSSMASRIRADRKGAVAHATAATLGMIFVTLAMGHPDLALLMSLGHAAFRMIQILRAPNVITDSQNLRSALGRMPWPVQVPEKLYRLAWVFHRFHSDFHLLHVLHMLSRHVMLKNPPHLTKLQQWGVTGLIVALAGAPFTALSHFKEELLMDLLHTHPAWAAGIMVGHFTLSVILIRFLFLNILNARRFQRDRPGWTYWNSPHKDWQIGRAHV